MIQVISIWHVSFCCMWPCFVFVNWFVNFVNLCYILFFFFLARVTSNNYSYIYSKFIPLYRRSFCQRKLFSHLVFLFCFEPKEYWKNSNQVWCQNLMIVQILVIPLRWVIFKKKKFFLSTFTSTWQFLCTRTFIVFSV